MIIPRYSVRRLTERGTSQSLGIWDDDQQAFAYRLPVQAPADLVESLLDAWARIFRPATVIYYTQRLTHRGDEAWELTVVHGDVISQGPSKRVVMGDGRLHVVPAERHVRTVWGATVTKLSPEARCADDGSTFDKIQVEGWTEPRHEQLYQLNLYGTSEVWFADFAVRFGLATNSRPWNPRAARDGMPRPLLCNEEAKRLLRRWNREHPETARRLYRIAERVS